MIDRFTEAYYDGALFGETRADTHWLGVRTDKNPLDLWIYQELLHELRPDLIVETGTAFGGSALYLASICDLLDHGKVVTVDIIEQEGRPQHPRLEYVTGSSIALEIVEDVKRRIGPGGTAMVVLDSNHKRDHVLEELRLYAPLVTPGSYIVVEDTILNGHPVSPEFGPGPMEAVEAFLAETDEFEVDRRREKLYLTFNRKGYLRRKPTLRRARRPRPPDRRHRRLGAASADAAPCARRPRVRGRVRRAGRRRRPGALLRRARSRRRAVPARDRGAGGSGARSRRSGPTSCTRISCTPTSAERCRGPDAPLVSTKHNDDPFRTGAFRFVERALGRRARAVICITESLARFQVGARRHPPREGHGDPLRARRAAAGVVGRPAARAAGGGTRRCSALGRLVPQKGYDVSLRAFTRIREAHPGLGAR